MWTWIVAAMAAPLVVGSGGGDGGTRRPDGELLSGVTPSADPYVTNGQDATPGEWPDVANVNGCTGTLIHPRFIVTAAHCTESEGGPAGRGTQVAVGLNSWRELRQESDDAASVAVAATVRRVYFPPGVYRDIALLELDEPVASITPRTLAADCILAEDLVRGAEVAVVGWGATQFSGDGWTPTLQEGVTYVQSPECDTDRVKTDAGEVYAGCQSDISPGGEIGAGGGDVDACFGDSGGPLYLLTDRGDYLIGVTSRSYIGVPAREPCRYGGIYTRPDAVRDWIERVIGEALPRPVCTTLPLVEVPPIAVKAGTRRPVAFEVSDDGEAWTVRVGTPPAHGEVEIQGDRVFYRAPKGFSGPDPFTIEVVDDGTPAWPANPPGVTAAVVELDVFEGAPPEALKDRVVSACGGCASGGAGGVGIAGVVVGLGMLRRRR